MHPCVLARESTPRHCVERPATLARLPCMNKAEFLRLLRFNTLGFVVLTLGVTRGGRGHVRSQHSPDARRRVHAVVRRRREELDHCYFATPLRCLHHHDDTALVATRRETAATAGRTRGQLGQLDRPACFATAKAPNGHRMHRTLARAGVCLILRSPTNPAVSVDTLDMGLRRS